MSKNTSGNKIMYSYAQVWAMEERFNKIFEYIFNDYNFSELLKNNNIYRKLKNIDKIYKRSKQVLIHLRNSVLMYYSHCHNCKLYNSCTLSDLNALKSEFNSYTLSAIDIINKIKGIYKILIGDVKHSSTSLLIKHYNLSDIITNGINTQEKSIYICNILENLLIPLRRTTSRALKKIDEILSPYEYLYLLNSI